MHNAIDIRDTGAKRSAHLVHGRRFNQAIVDPRMLTWPATQYSNLLAIGTKALRNHSAHAALIGKYQPSPAGRQEALLFRGTARSH